MANRLPTALSALTGANMASGDLFVLFDVSDTTDDASGTMKKVTRDEAKIGLAVKVQTRQKLTVGSGTYSTPSGCTLIVGHLVAGGGQGGGVAGSATQAGAGSGGGSGGEIWFAFASPAASYAYLVGAKGSTSVAGANDGQVGADSTFAATTSLLTAKGGAGGIAGVLGTTTQVVNRGGFGGVVATDAGSAAFVLGGGRNGGISLRWSATANMAGQGGEGPFGGAGGGQSGNGDGFAAIATGYGSGGAGAVVASVNTAKAGGAGADGVLIVYEYYS